MICLGLCLGLAACAAGGGTGAPAATEAPATPTQEEILAASAADAAELGEDTPPASDTDADIFAAAFEEAGRCVGQPVDELYQALGEPTEASYAASCLEEDAEDGILIYSDFGFYVWTLRTADAELVHAVYPLE